MQCSTKLEGDILNAELDGEIDHHTAREIREKIDEEIKANEPNHLFLNFKNVSFMDSSGIGLVMGRYRSMREVGGDVHIVSPSPGIKKVMKLAGMDRLAVIDE